MVIGWREASLASVPLAVISPGDSDNMFLPVSSLKIGFSSPCFCSSKLDSGSWQVSSTCAIIYIGKEGDYFSRAQISV